MYRMVMNDGKCREKEEENKDWKKQLVKIVQAAKQDMRDRTLITVTKWKRGGASLTFQGY